MKKTLLMLLALGTMQNASSSTLYLDSTTPYNYGTKEYKEFRRNYESKLSQICKDYKLNHKRPNESFAREVNFIASYSEHPFLFRISHRGIEFKSMPYSEQAFVAKCR